MNYLVIKCEELGDQWECDANRIPVCITDDYSKYNIYGYEIYPINEDGTIGDCIKDFDEDSSPIELVAYRYIDGAEEDYQGCSDIEILESIKTKYTSDTKETCEKIANSTNFSKLVKKYLDLNEATLADYKKDFIRQSYCDEYDYVDEENGIVISLKQGNRVTRNY